MSRYPIRRIDRIGAFALKTAGFLVARRWEGRGCLFVVSLLSRGSGCLPRFAVCLNTVSMRCASKPCFATRWCPSSPRVHIQILERVAAEELDLPRLKTRHTIKVRATFVGVPDLANAIGVRYEPHRTPPIRSDPPTADAWRKARGEQKLGQQK